MVDFYFIENKKINLKKNLQPKECNIVVNKEGLNTTTHLWFCLCNKINFN